MAKKVFGTYPDVGGNPSSSNGSDIGNGLKLYTGSYCSNLTLEPGDVIRKGGHSAIIWSVDGNIVKVGEVWGNPSKASNNCKISWGYFNASSGNTASTLLNNPTFVAKAPKDNGGTTLSGNTYRISNVGASTSSVQMCLNINGDNVTSLSNGINVTLWSSSPPQIIHVHQYKKTSAHEKRLTIFKYSHHHGSTTVPASHRNNFARYSSTFIPFAQTVAATEYIIALASAPFNDAENSQFFRPVLNVNENMVHPQITVF